MDTVPESNYQVFKKESTEVDTKPRSNFQDIKKRFHKKMDYKLLGGDEVGDVAGEKKEGDGVGKQNGKVELEDDFGCKIFGKTSENIIDHQKHLAESHSNFAIGVAKEVVSINSKQPRRLHRCETCEQNFFFVNCHDLHFKTKLLDHISDVFNIMSSKKDHEVHFIMAGDTNKLKLNPINSLSPNMKQIFSKPTRFNPPRMLDPLLTTLSNLYQLPEILPPLDNDPEKNGKPSDHSIVVVEPISELKSTCSRQMRKVIVRPTPENKLKLLKSHF